MCLQVSIWNLKSPTHKSFIFIYFFMSIKVFVFTIFFPHHKKKKQLKINTFILTSAMVQLLDRNAVHTAQRHKTPFLRAFMFVNASKLFEIFWNGSI